MNNSLTNDYPPNPLSTPSLTCHNSRVVHTHKPSRVNNEASKKKLYYKIFAVLFTMNVAFHSGYYTNCLLSLNIFQIIYHASLNAVTLYNTRTILTHASDIVRLAYSLDAIRLPLDWQYRYQ